jgi:hypothetical protein
MNNDEHKLSEADPELSMNMKCIANFAEKHQQIYFQINANTKYK